MRFETLVTAVLAASTLALAACGGSGSRATLTDDELERILSDPRVVRLEEVLDRSDTLLVSSEHLNYSLTAEGRTIGERIVERMSCTGASCAGDEGTELSVQDLINPSEQILDPSDEIRPTEVDIGSRSGFDTVTLGARFEASESIEDVTISAAPSVFSFGFWGEHGFGAVDVTDGSISGSIEGIPFDGSFGVARAYVAGTAAGTNPTGTGSATWSGIAEAATTGDFQRHRGIATVTIADLSQPRVGVDIDISGQDIGSPGWADIPLTDGRFASGSVGTSDFLEGNFHGPDHGETYGVFDTGTYVGAFGAKRDQ